jgi:hypothetical protein
MRILSKSRARATAVVTVLLAGACSSVLPWSDEPIGSEVNLAFKLERNLIELQSVRIDNREGRFILGSAAPHTVVDSKFPLSETNHVIQFGPRQTVRITPSATDLGGVADAIVGAEAWGKHAISIDYHAGLVIWQKEGIKPELMHVYRFPAEPTINVMVNGREIPAVVDTSSPDTLVLSGADRRETARVRVADTDFGEIDVRYTPVSQARIGNRLLSRFLVTIDYGRKVVGLWRDPRIPIAAGSPSAEDSAVADLRLRD